MRAATIRLLLISIFTFPLLLVSQSIQQIKSCVSFIYLPDSKGSLRPNGTGFFIGVDDTVRQRTYIYTITSRHVLWDTASKSFVRETWLRLNTKSGDASFVRMSMTTKGVRRNVFTHADSTVDLVAVLGIPDEDKYDFNYIPSEIVRTSQDLKRLGLGEGTDIFFPALFVPHIGEHKNYPIVRFGKLALVSDERIMWDNQLQRLFLIESISIGGHSGAPVFAWFEPLVKPGTMLSHEEKRIRLIGVMKGFFELERPIGVRETRIIPIFASHTGISAVVPVDLMQEILFSAEATDVRNRD